MLYARIHLREMNWVRPILNGKQAKQYLILCCKEECHWKKMTHHNNHNRTKDRWCLPLPICFWQVGCSFRDCYLFLSLIHSSKTVQSSLSEANAGDHFCQIIWIWFQYELLKSSLNTLNMFFIIGQPIYKVFQIWSNHKVSQKL